MKVNSEGTDQELKIPEVKEEVDFEMKQFLEEAKKKLAEQQLKREQKRLLKQRIWFQGNLISREEWEAVPEGDRLASNNAIRRSK